jgi:short-subunit dehydrogenase
MRQFMLSNRIDTIINNAGVYQSGPLEDLGNDQISDVIRVNLTSQILAIQTAYNLFKADGRGTIVNINSLAGITPSANETVYAAAKHGFRGFSKSLQLEAIGTGIEIIDVFPGAMKTQMTKDRPNHDQLMDPAEVADTVLDMITSTRRLSINEMVIRRKP